MKTLQNNFTTPEQSKRLLELGVPADSADCYYTQEEIEGNMYWFNLHIKREYQPHTSLHASTMWGEILPCWSVGRLIEIFEICTPYKIEQFVFTGTYIEQICKAFLFAKEMKSLDFSKLEE